MAGVTRMLEMCRGGFVVGMVVSPRPVDGLRIPFPTITELKLPLRKEDKSVPDWFVMWDDAPISMYQCGSKEV